MLPCPIALLQVLAKQKSSPAISFRQICHFYYNVCAGAARAMGMESIELPDLPKSEWVLGANKANSKVLADAEAEFQKSDLLSILKNNSEENRDKYAAAVALDCLAVPTTCPRARSPFATVHPCYRVRTVVVSGCARGGAQDELCCELAVCVLACRAHVLAQLGGDTSSESRWLANRFVWTPPTSPTAFPQEQRCKHRRPWKC